VFDDPGAFDDIVTWILLTVAAILLVSAIVLVLVTWLIARWARKRGRRGGRPSAFVAALGSEVFLIAALGQNPRRIDATVVWWLLSSAVVIGVATFRLCQPNPAVTVPDANH
jgi:MFS family permease